MLNKMKNLLNNEEGQGMTEYGLVLGAIGIGVVAVLVLLRDQIRTLITSITTGVGASSTGVQAP
jgi:pilus assembly protein Flp/PilA